MNQLRLIQGGTAQRTKLPSPTANTERATYGGPGLDEQTLHALLKEASRDFEISIRPTRRENSATWTDHLDAILEELGRLSNDWAGAGTIAPEQTVLEDIQTLVAILPLGTRKPDIEVDPSDGEVKMAWRSETQPKSIAIALRGDKRAVVLQSNLNAKLTSAHAEIGLAQTELRASGRTLQMLEQNDLFLKA